MSPVRAELRSLSRNYKYARTTTQRLPSSPSRCMAFGQSNVAESGFQALANDTAVAEAYFVHARVSIGRDSVSHAVDDEHTSELQSHHDLVCRLLLEKKKKQIQHTFEYNQKHTI